MQSLSDYLATRLRGNAGSNPLPFQGDPFGSGMGAITDYRDPPRGQIAGGYSPQQGDPFGAGSGWAQGTSDTTGRPLTGGKPIGDIIGGQQGGFSSGNTTWLKPPGGAPSGGKLRPQVGQSHLDYGGTDVPEWTYKINPATGRPEIYHRLNRNPTDSTDEQMIAQWTAPKGTYLYAGDYNHVGEGLTREQAIARLKGWYELSGLDTSLSPLAAEMNGGGGGQQYGDTPSSGGIGQPFTPPPGAPAPTATGNQPTTGGGNMPVNQGDPNEVGTQAYMLGPDGQRMAATQYANSRGWDMNRPGYLQEFIMDMLDRSLDDFLKVAPEAQLLGYASDPVSFINSLMNGNQISNIRNFAQSALQDRAGNGFNGMSAAEVEQLLGTILPMAGFGQNPYQSAANRRLLQNAASQFQVANVNAATKKGGNTVNPTLWDYLMGEDAYKNLLPRVNVNPVTQPAAPRTYVNQRGPTPLVPATPQPYAPQPSAGGGGGRY